jgi:hypothetical protein
VDYPRLVRPGTEWYPAFVECARDFRDAGESRYADLVDASQEEFAAFVRSRLAMADDATVPAGFVP